MNPKAVLLILMVSLVAALAGASGAEEDPTSGPQSQSPPRDPYAISRELLVEQYIIGAGIQNPAVIDAMYRVQRHEFVPPEYRDMAHLDRPLPIDAGQTISQPYVVAFMTEALDLQPDDKVLEVGTGSGYQAAVLAAIVAEVYSIEIIDTLAVSARAVLGRLVYPVTVVSGDGYYGLPDQAPFDAIIVTAAAGHVPPPLVDQLKPGGRMIIPVGPVYSVQVLILLEKALDGSISTQQLLPVRFVPMTGRVQE